jgi:hypothetical protein
MKAALVGLMQSGKSTLFSAISGKQPPPMGAATLEEAIVPVPDERLDYLEGVCKPEKTTPATIDCLDVPGFNFTDDRGSKNAHKMMDKIRTTDLLVWVVRGYKDKSVPPYKNRVDPAADLQELKTEFLLADLDLVTTRIEKLEKQVKKPTDTQAKDKAELELQKKLQDTIEQEKPLSSAIKTDSELAIIKSLNFLTLKPIVVAVNIGEDQLGQKFEFPELGDDIPIIEISAKLEREISQLDKESKEEFTSDMGIKESALSKFVNSCYSALGLISFLTIGSDEVRAWPVRKGTTAHKAAGKVHSDIQRGFIRAETFSFEDFKQYGDEKTLRSEGKIRLEGKDYVVKDGDIINFRFNV